MKIAIVPHLEQLIAVVNPNGRVSPDIICTSYLPGVYAPWPDARKNGFIEIDIEGDTLRALLVEIGARYKLANVDFEPICPVTNDLRWDYNVFVNGQKYTLITHGLKKKLKDGDEIRITSDTMGHC